MYTSGGGGGGGAPEMLGDERVVAGSGDGF